MTCRSKTRSNGTVHTSAKTHLTSVAIRMSICDLDRHQNLIICSLAYWHLPSKFHAICLEVFVQLLTDKQRRLHILLGGGK